VQHLRAQPEQLVDDGVGREVRFDAVLLGQALQRLAPERQKAGPVVREVEEAVLVHFEVQMGAVGTSVDVT
jgi:hypothetical protein